jgi:hypothetical protein
MDSMGNKIYDSRYIMRGHRRNVCDRNRIDHITRRLCSNLQQIADIWW